MTNEKTWWTRAVGGFRILTSRGAIALLAALLLFSSHVYPEDGWVDSLLEVGGMLLILAGVFGRLWSTLFISGYKTKSLITVGPYSIVRNPLYCFSFLGAIGVAMATEMLTLVLLVALLFALYYPTVILLEEQKLRQIHGAAFDDYCRRVPSVWPKFSLYEEPEFYDFNPRLFRKAALDSIWFLLAYPIIEIIERLHEAKVLPVYFQLY